MGSSECYYSSPGTNGQRGLYTAHNTLYPGNMTDINLSRGRQAVFAPWCDSPPGSIRHIDLHISPPTHLVASHWTATSKGWVNSFRDCRLNIVPVENTWGSLKAVPHA